MLRNSTLKKPLKIVITVLTSLPPSYMNSTTHCSKMELSGYTNDCFSTTERSFQHRMIVSRQQTERLCNRMSDRFKTMNRRIASTKWTTVSSNEWNDRLTQWTIVSKQRTERSFTQRNGAERLFNTTERNDRFNTTKWNGTIVLTQRNGTEQLFYHNRMEWNWNSSSIARDTNGNFLLTPTVAITLSYWTLSMLHPQVIYTIVFSAGLNGLQLD